MASSTVVNESEEKNYYAALKLASKDKHKNDLMSLKWVNVVMQHERVKIGSNTYRVIDKVQSAEGIQKKLVVQQKGYPEREIVALEDTYPVVLIAHEKTSHGGIEAMTKWLIESKISVADICLPTIMESCEKCQRKGSSQYQSIATVCIVDMSQEQSDKTFDCIMVYQDKKTHFLQIRPIYSADFIELVSNELVLLFTDFGTPECIEVQPSQKENFEKILSDTSNMFFNRNIVLEFCDERVPLVKAVEFNVANWIICNPGRAWSEGCSVVTCTMNTTSSGNEKTAFQKRFHFSDNEEDQIAVIDEFLSENHVPEEPSDRELSDIDILEVNNININV